jgi:serine/threonine protein kinase
MQCSQICEGVSFLHLQTTPIVHGDIKPVRNDSAVDSKKREHLCLIQENVLVDDEGNACIADFGLSVALDGFSTGRTRSILGGTFRYLAPELMGSDNNEDNGDDDAVQRTTESDIYALACTCCQVSKATPILL